MAARMTVNKDLEALLHYCLKEMKEAGYEYAIIGQAGPIEFYEKACQARVIPIKSSF
ncbi:hypothetical protein [Gracilibacillus dipsosauri]|uniref:hypothetical protein n=1 Tax=Gracilibacillus dipsosauri TaxID=178340 RepID=UPI003CCC7A69